MRLNPIFKKPRRTSTVGGYIRAWDGRMGRGTVERGCSEYGLTLLEDLWYVARTRTLSLIGRRVQDVSPAIDHGCLSVDILP